MDDYQIKILLSLPVYSFILWLFFRLWYLDRLEPKNNPNQMQTVNRELQTKYDNAIHNNVSLCKIIEQLEVEIKTLKTCNKALTNSLQTINETNKSLVVKEKYAHSTFQNDVFDSGTTFDEIDAMVQIMNGRRVSRQIYDQGLQAIHKTQGTEIYDRLIEKIAGAKQQVEGALNAENEKNDDGWDNFDIKKYIQE
jgi:ATP phosphoribosyltransferase regulatory subunit HisZ